MPTTPRQLADASLDAVRRGDRDGWLALFEEDATVEDPVGSSELDPEGRGRRGKAEIARFYDDVISTMERFDYEIERSYQGGDEVAVVVVFWITAGGQTMNMDLVNVYRRSAGGKIASLRSFWDGSRQGVAENGGENGGGKT